MTQQLGLKVVYNDTAFLQLPDTLATHETVCCVPRYCIAKGKVS
jgi:hypothetical protein